MILGFIVGVVDGLLVGVVVVNVGFKLGALVRVG